MKRCSASLTIREKQVKTTVRCHVTPARMASIKKIRGSPGGEAVRIPAFHGHGPSLIPVVGEHPTFFVAWAKRKKMR